jgi:hypothetical protein
MSIPRDDRWLDALKKEYHQEHVGIALQNTPRYNTHQKKILGVITNVKSEDKRIQTHITYIYYIIVHSV